ncbi:MAG: DUF11 domain-containing protein [Acidobacteria bacterium]|nr:MAG: DUF11 domain-containing protein [Acidobacteriota bacterium]
MLTVTGGASEPILLTKEFTDDPVPPGGTVTLRFTITNTDRSNTATGISFTDDLTTALAGLLFTGVTSNTCDATPTGTGTSTISFAGGSLAPESSCTFEVTVSVPGGATQGTFTNTTSTITATINGDPVSGSAASDLLFVVAFPVLTKSFTDDPVGAGGTVTLEFTITNTSTSALSSIAFIDELTDGSGGFPPDPTSGFLPFPVSVTLPPTPDPPCGGGSSLALVSIDTDRQGLSLTGGSLAAAGSPGDSCTFSLTVDVPDGFPGGSYTNFTEEITAVLDDVAGTPTVTGPGASGVLVVEGAPILTKEFTDDPVPPGGTATLVFTLTHDVNATADATAIAFSDDLTTVLAGLTATAVAGNTCTGATVDLSTPTLIAVSGGSLMPGETCTITVTLAVPGSALPGSFTNTTSSVTATVGGVATTGNPASDDLIIAGLTLTKSFTDDPALPGDTVTLRFTLDNSAGTAAASGIFFTDTLSTVLSGLVVVPPLPDTSACGAGSSIVDVGGFLLFSLGSLSAGAPPCSFDVTLMVPAGAADDFYLNVTSSLSATIGTTPLTLGSASDVLEVNSALLGISKSFTDDPAVPGGTVTLEFTIDNLDLARAASAVAFTDDLGAALAGLTINSVLFDDCGGVAGGVGTTMLSYAGGSLAAGGSCTVRLLLDVPAGPVAGGTFTNTTSTVTGTVIGNSGGSFPVSGAAASDDLRVVTLTLDKAFSGTGFPGETVDLTFTLTNLDSSAGASNLSFSDSLPAGLTAVAPLPDTSSCGAGSSISGTSFLTFSGGSLGPSGSCSFTVTLQVPAAATPGTFVNTTSDLFSAGLSVSGPASDALTIEPPPAFTKSFGLNPASVGSISTLTFTIDNSASGVAATGLAFTDVLPAGLVIAAVPNVVDGCGGSVTAAPGASTITYTGGTVAAGAVCTVRVDVTPTAIGSPVNVTGDLTSSSGNSGTATDTLTAIATPITTFTGPTATGAGDATVTISGGGPNCGFQQVAWIALEGDPGSPPAGSAPAGEFFPFGLLDFVLMNCVPGATVDFTLTFPNAFPADADYWKYGPVPSDPTPQWYMLPATFAANVITFSITDGGLGDDDLTADGSITEPGGPAHLAVVPPIDVPTLGSGLLVLLALLLAGLGVARLRRR